MENPEEHKTAEPVEPKQKTMNIVKQVTLWFEHTDFDVIDDDMNVWLEEKFREGKNPIIADRKIIDDQTYMFCLYTEKINID